MHRSAREIDGGVAPHVEHSCSSQPIGLFKDPERLACSYPDHLVATSGATSRKSTFISRGPASPQLLGQKRLRWQLRKQPASIFASIGGVGDAAARAASSVGNSRTTLEGPGNVLRLHAEELRQAASERAHRNSEHQAKSRRRKRQRQTKEQKEQKQQQRQQVLGEGVTYVKHMLAGALSACVSKTIVAPLERVKMDCILRRRGISTAVVTLDIIRDEGILGFWRGNLLNVLRTAPYKAVNFSSYDAYRKLLTKAYGQKSLDRGGSFAAGAMAGVTASLICFPLDVVRTRILAAPHGSSLGPLALMRSIVRTEGFGGLYSGVLPALISVAPSGAVFYGTYDVLKERHLAGKVARGEERELGTLYTLLYGGLAGVAAETAVYPLQMMQRHLQLQMSADAASFAMTALSPKEALKLARLSGPSHHLFKSAYRLRSAATAIYTRHGLAGFYTGILPNVMQVLPNAALSYYAYEAFKRVLDATD